VSGDQEPPHVVGSVAQIAAGDPATESAFAAYFAARIRAMLRARLRQADPIQDLMRDALVAAILALRKGQLREPDRLAAFVHGVVRNLVNSHLRGQARRGEAPFDDDIAARLVVTDSREDEERRRMVAKGLSAIAPADREVLQLTLVDGLHPREIAQRLSLSSDTVRQRKTRALKRLKAAVEGGREER
jgi:RNA polymerase sigma-70 factor, ECF subfamily